MDACCAVGWVFLAPFSLDTLNAYLEKWFSSVSRSWTWRMVLLSMGSADACAAVYAWLLYLQRVSYPCDQIFQPLRCSLSRHVAQPLRRRRTLIFLINLGPRKT